MLRVDHFSDILIGILPYHLYTDDISTIIKETLAFERANESNTLSLEERYINLFDLHVLPSILGSLGLSFLMIFDCHLDRLTLMEGAGLGCTGWIQSCVAPSGKSSKFNWQNQYHFLQRDFAYLLQRVGPGTFVPRNPKTNPNVTSAASSSGTLYTWRASCPGTSPQ